MKRSVLLLAGAVAAGCAGPSSPTKGAVARADRSAVICDTGRPTGSNLLVEDCRTADARDADAAEAQEAMRRLLQQQTPNRR